MLLFLKIYKGDFVGEGYTELINSKLLILRDDHLRHKSILKR
jgi:hypothetical protein